MVAKPGYNPGYWVLLDSDQRYFPDQPEYLGYLGTNLMTWYFKYSAINLAVKENFHERVPTRYQSSTY